MGQNILWNVFSALYTAQAVFAAAMACKGLCHLPFGGWIKKGQLITG